MMTIQEAMSLLQTRLPAPQAVTVELADAAGLVLAGDIHANEPSPRYTNSAMDGFAVRWADIESASAEKPVALTLIGESQAGIPFQGQIASGQAARINTGAMLCDGADAVVPIEEARLESGTVLVLAAKKHHQHLRFEGEEFPAGELLLKEGTVLKPVELALLAGQGIAEVSVFRPPAVSIIVTGTELVAYDKPLEPWQIRDSNGIMLRTAVTASGGHVVMQDRVGDDFRSTVEALQDAAEIADIVIFSGGVSVGPHDLVKKAAAECGFETVFWRVRQKPGKPLFVASRGETLFFGLPGNPVSAYMCYAYYIHPAMAALQGRPFAHQSVTGELHEELSNTINRAQLFRVRMHRVDGVNQVYPLPRQGSHMLTSVSEARGFVLLEIGANYAAGESVEVILLG